MTSATLTTSSGTAATFSGQITGAIALTKTANAAAGVLTLTAAQTYTGDTNILGGGLTLADDAVLASSTINVNYGTLSLNNQGSGNTGIPELTNRILDSAAVRLNGGTLGLLSLSSGGNTSETLGTVTLAQGGITISSNNSSSTSSLFINNLVRSTADGATVNFFGNGGSAVGGSSLANFFLNQVNGGAVTLTGNILGGWAYVTASTTADGWATYNQDGAGNANANGIQFLATSAYTTLDGAITTLASTANARITATGTTTLNASLPSSVVVNSLFLNPSAATASILDLNGKTLVLTTGGLLRSLINAATQTIQNGTLTAGSGGNAELFANISSNTTTISSLIADNGTGVVTLVKSGAGGLTLTGNNAAVGGYTGATIVNGGTLTLSLAGADGSTSYAIPAALRINGATVTLTAAGQIKSSSSVVLNGNSTLTMSGSNTLSSLTINGNGGVAGASSGRRHAFELKLRRTDYGDERQHRRYSDDFPVPPRCSSTPTRPRIKAPVSRRSALSSPPSSIPEPWGRSIRPVPGRWCSTRPTRLRPASS